MVPGHRDSMVPTASIDDGSRLLVGSSSSSTLARPAASMAKPSLARSPPESVLGIWWAALPDDAEHAEQGPAFGLLHQDRVVDVLEHGDPEVDLLVLLGEVPERDVGAQFDPTARGSLHPSQAAQQAGLAGTVPPDDHGPITAAAVEVDVAEHDGGVVADRQPGGPQRHLAGASGRREPERALLLPLVHLGLVRLQSLHPLVQRLGDPGPPIGAAPHGVGQGGQPL